MIKRICIIANGYPSPERVVNTFVDQLVCQFADNGIDCVVISPQSLTNILFKKQKKLAYTRERITNGENIIKVIVPKYISFSALKKGIVNTSIMTLHNFIGAVDKAFRSEHQKKPFDAVYGHFIYESGITANYISKKFKIPGFFAYGENTTYTIDYLGAKKTSQLLDNIKGVISVSTDNKDILIRHKIVPSNIIQVFPNSIDSELFYPRDKQEMRKKYNLPKDGFIIAFVGRFVEIKGANRLSQAINDIDSPEIKSIFIGSGDIGPTCDGILIQGNQPHDVVPELLSTADIFVLPTQAEGCCNAIIEAMACGLPIISSNLPFNDDILDDTCSIRIDPNNIEEITKAIKVLLNNKELRNKLALGALKKADKLDIKRRAANIMDFMQSKLQND